MKWELLMVDFAIDDILTSVLAAIILGTLMVAAGLWKRNQIDRTEVKLYRIINNMQTS